MIEGIFGAVMALIGGAILLMTFVDYVKEGGVMLSVRPKPEKATARKVVTIVLIASWLVYSGVDAIAEAIAR